MSTAHELIVQRGKSPGACRTAAAPSGPLPAWATTPRQQALAAAVAASEEALAARKAEGGGALMTGLTEEEQAAAQANSKREAERRAKKKAEAAAKKAAEEEARHAENLKRELEAKKKAELRRHKTKQATQLKTKTNSAWGALLKGLFQGDERGDEAKLRELFDSIDLDGGGTIDQDELRQALVGAGMEDVSDAEIAYMIGVGDGLGEAQGIGEVDGEIEFDEFCHVMKVCVCARVLHLPLATIFLLWPASSQLAPYAPHTAPHGPHPPKPPHTTLWKHPFAGLHLLAASRPPRPLLAVLCMARRGTRPCSRHTDHRTEGDAGPCAQGAREALAQEAGVPIGREARRQGHGGGGGGAERHGGMGGLDRPDWRGAGGDACTPGGLQAGRAARLRLHAPTLT